MNSFLDALAIFLKSMPDHQPFEAIEKIRAKSSVCPPGITDSPTRKAREPGPLRILWAARWEHDKNPEDFFKALEILKAGNVPFRISVIGQSFRDRPVIFDRAYNDFKDHIDLWGYQQGREDYQRALTQADVIVSTANHEFFGVSIVEAIAMGAYPLVPNRLSYPEILGLGRIKVAEQFFYDGTAKDLAEKLSWLAAHIEKDNYWPKSIRPAMLTDKLKWQKLAPLYDKSLEQIHHDTGGAKPAEDSV